MKLLSKLSLLLIAFVGVSLALTINGNEKANPRLLDDAVSNEQSNQANLTSVRDKR